MLDGARPNIPTFASRLRTGIARRRHSARSAQAVAQLQSRAHSRHRQLDARQSVGAGAQPGDAARRHHRARHGPVDPHRLRHHRLLQGGRRAHLQGRAERGTGGAIHLCARCAVEIRHRPAGGDERDPHHHRRPHRAAHPRRPGRHDDAEGRSAPVADVCPPGADIRRRRDGRHGGGVGQPAPAADGGRLRSGSALSSWRSPPISRSPFCRSARSIGRWPSSRPRTTSSGVRTCSSIRRSRTWCRGWRCSTPRQRVVIANDRYAELYGIDPAQLQAGHDVARDRRAAHAPKVHYAGSSADDVVREMAERSPPSRSAASSTCLPMGASSPSSIQPRARRRSGSRRTRTSPSARLSMRGWRARTSC